MIILDRARPLEGKPRSPWLAPGMTCERRFDPSFYAPLAPLEEKRKQLRVGYSTMDSCDVDPEEPRDHAFESSSHASVDRLPPVRGRAIGLDKTELDEVETRAFLRFVEEADKNKKVNKRRVRMLPTTEGS